MLVALERAMLLLLLFHQLIVIVIMFILQIYLHVILVFSFLKQRMLFFKVLFNLRFNLSFKLVMKSSYFKVIKVGNSRDYHLF